MVHFVYAPLLLVLHDDNTWIMHELHPTIFLVPVYTKDTIQSNPSCLNENIIENTKESESNRYSDSTT